MSSPPVFVEPRVPAETDTETGLPIGPLLAKSEPALLPDRQVIEGRYCRLEPLDPGRHSEDLFIASTPDDAKKRFLYLPDLVPDSVEQMRQWTEHAASLEDPRFYAVIDRATDRVAGRQSFLNISPQQQSIEIGHIYWGPAIAGTRVSTEANYLFAKMAFESWGYRRFEWKCNALNQPSRQAALRLGFSYEGHFRRAAIVHGRSRDTSWFSMIDEDWAVLKPAYEQWLDPQNFAENGQQMSRLSELSAAALGQR